MIEKLVCQIKVTVVQPTCRKLFHKKKPENRKLLQKHMRLKKLSTCIPVKNYISKRRFHHFRHPYLSLAHSFSFSNITKREREKIICWLVVCSNYLVYAAYLAQLV